MRACTSAPLLPLADGAIDDLLTRVRTQIVAELERAALSGGALELVGDALQRHLVGRALDPESAVAWIPIDHARLKLRDRIRALFVADAMNDPAAYDTLFVCHRCEAVVFDEVAKLAGACAQHRTVSAMVTRSGSCPGVSRAF